MQATGNETYRAILPPVDTEKSIRYYFEATDIQNQSTREPYAGEFELNIVLPVSDPLFHSLNTTLDVYPNPASSWFEISVTGEFKKMVYQIFDLSGKKILEGESPVSPALIRVRKSEIAGGVYLLFISIEGEYYEIITVEHRKLIFLE